LLGLTAAGLLCYALYCLVDARYRDVSVSGRGGKGSDSEAVSRPSAATNVDRSGSASAVPR
jgi:hypothetical protein